MPLSHASEVDETLKERGSHGSYELPIETYTDNCYIFQSLYNHWHNEMELIYVDDGRGFARLNRESIRLKKGYLLIINSGVLHSMKTDMQSILCYKSIVFHPEFLSGCAGDWFQECVIAPLLEHRLEITHLITPTDERYSSLESLFMEIHECHKHKQSYYYAKLKSLFFDFFYELLAGNYLIPADNQQPKNITVMKQVFDYIREHYSEPLTVGELTNLSHYSENYFMKLFKEYTGKTLISYINDYRLEQAKALLLHTDLSITEIALCTGFNSTSYFIKKFQEANGCSPHKYRKQS